MEPNELVTMFLVEATTAAKYLHQRYYLYLSLDEIKSECHYGLVMAARNWENYCSGHGYSPTALEYFAAYARRRMRGAVIDKLRGMDTLSRSERKAYQANPEAGLAPNRMMPLSWDANAPATREATMITDYYSLANKVAGPYSTAAEVRVKLAARAASAVYLSLPEAQRLALAGYELCPRNRNKFTIPPEEWGLSTGVYGYARCAGYAILINTAEFFEAHPNLEAPPRATSSLNPEKALRLAEAYGLESAEQLYSCYAEMLIVDSDVLARAVKRAYPFRKV